MFCRVRPLLGEELLGSDGTINHMAFPDSDSKILELEKMSDAGLNEVNIPGFFSFYFIRPICIVGSLFVLLSVFLVYGLFLCFYTELPDSK